LGDTSIEDIIVIRVIIHHNMGKFDKETNSGKINKLPKDD
jgi:hypothetical protein